MRYRYRIEKIRVPITGGKPVLPSLRELGRRVIHVLSAPKRPDSIHNNAFTLTVLTEEEIPR